METITKIRRKIFGATVQEIHEEFDSAQERLLEEAKNIINNTKTEVVSEEEILLEKSARLKKIGFVNSKEVKIANNIQKKIEKNGLVLSINKSQADLIEYYKLTYPFQKFLTEDELNRICKKYNLIYAPVANYINSIPDKNLKEIENCTVLKSSDKFDREALVTCDTHWRIEELEAIREALKKPNNIYKESECIELLKKYGPHSIRNELSYYSIFGARKNMFFYYLAAGLHNADLLKKNEYPTSYTLKTTNKEGYYIAAPKSHFNLKDLKKKNKFGFFNVSITEVKDPIVFQYCRGEMIRVITKWGDEAKDELLINSIDN